MREITAAEFFSGRLLGHSLINKVQVVGSMTATALSNPLRHRGNHWMDIICHNNR